MNYHYVLRNIPEERNSNLLHGANLKSSGTLNECSVADVIMRLLKHNVMCRYMSIDLTELKSAFLHVTIPPPLHLNSIWLQLHALHLPT